MLKRNIEECVFQVVNSFLVKENKQGIEVNRGTFFWQLGLDSMGGVELASAIEEKFEFDISDEDYSFVFNAESSIGELIDFVQSRVESAIV